MKVIYLANPYGFSTQQKSVLLPEIMDSINSLGSVDIWEPFDRNDQVDFSKSGWAFEISQRDLNDVRNSDAIFAVVNGNPPDEGVMIELGVAIALGKKVFLFRDDFRRCTDSEEYPLNLMVFSGLPRDDWRDYFYTSVDEIKNPNKALARWIRS